MIHRLLHRFSIRQRLYACVALVTLLLLGLGAWSQFGQRQSLGVLQQILDDQQATTSRIGALRAALARAKQYEMSMMVTPNTLEIERYRELWQGELKLLAEGFLALGKSNEAMREQAAAGVAALAEYGKAIAPLADQLVAAKIDGIAASAYAEQASAHLALAAKSLDALVAQVETALAAARMKAERGVALQSTLSALLGLAAVGLLALAMTVTARSICDPIEGATLAARRIADGNLAVEGARAEGTDEAARMLRALADMRSSLAAIVTQVAQAARTVADTSTQIAQGNLDLSQRTEEQASTLEETAGSMEQLTATVAQNADHAREASQLAVQASEVARRGGQAVGQVVSTMDGISASSRRIGDIIGVIDGIAFQTNILALNAAVEAARAGEQGRGFAVVASEVRNLAQRSAAAAKEIKALIGESVARVEAGTRQVDAAGKTMEEIVQAVRKVSDLIAEIAAASREQSAGIGQVNTAVAQMEQVVQQNASLVEQASAATESMKEQAAMLLQAVSRFRLGEQLQAAPQQRVEHASAVAPIRVRPSAAALPPAAAARTPRAIAGVPRQRQPF
ncbi:MAG TPA: methyl-accepting chemotaxis protein [Methylibium sp.]|nr:methyl-accepting chemotaxis protein [Methylibium sp.]